MKKMRKAAILIISLSVGGFLSGFAFAKAGTDSDPLVTLGYVEKRIEQIKFYVDEKVGSSSNTDASAGNVSVNELIVEKIEIGQKLIADSGAEIILRSGEAKAIVSEQGGLCDMTDGKDIGKDEIIPNNHMLIVPRSDGRGIVAVTEVYIMIRGKYKIVEKGVN